MIDLQYFIALSFTHRLYEPGKGGGALPGPGNRKNGEKVDVQGSSVYRQQVIKTEIF
jgi:hypothetical protein